MSEITIHPTINWNLAATAALTVACCAWSSDIFASSVAAQSARPAQGVYAQAPANRNAARVDAAERTARPFVYQRVVAGSGLTPVSAEVRGAPRVEQDVPLRTDGSIRSDIARYNEERSVPRSSGRQSDDARLPSNGAYRN